MRNLLMRTLLFVCLVCFIVLQAVHGDLSDEKRKQVEDLLRESALNSQESLNAKINRYDPILFSVLSNHISKTPNKDEDRWLQVELPPNEQSIDCPNNIRIMFKKSKRKNPYTYVIFTGGFAAFKEGTYVNQFSDIFNRKFKDPNIIAFPGFFHPDFLENSCESIPWDKVSISRDVYLRLRKFLRSIEADPEYSGIVGVSLGAYFTLMMLGHDSRFIDQQDENSVVFGLGGIAISPPLDAITTYKHLDGKSEENHIHPSISLTTHDIGNIYNWLRYLLFLERTENVVNFFESKRSEFVGRTFNEVTSVGLSRMLSGIDFNKDQLREVGYYHIFVETGFIESLTDSDSKQVLTDSHPLSYKGYENLELKVPLGSDSGIEKLYRLATKPFLRFMDHPILLYLSQDDPILYSQDSSGKLPEVITGFLDEASQNKNIITFHPKYGGHSGILLDPMFENLVSVFFSP